MTFFSIINKSFPYLSAARKVIFPILSIFSLFLSFSAGMFSLSIDSALTEYINANKYLPKRVNTVDVLPTKEEGEEILGTESKLDIEELKREYKRDNQSLRESTLQYSPSGKYTAFFQHKFVNDVKRISDGDYTYLVVNHAGTEEPIFKSDFRLSSFEWLNDGEVVVYRGCGTECRIAYVVTVATKEYYELPMGVGYTWSSDKRYVGSYHYSGRYGITVSLNESNRDGRAELRIAREPSPDYSSLIGRTEIAWSPDSSKFALIIKKDGEEKLELMVFSLSEDFPLLHRSTLSINSFDSFFWRGSDKIVYTSDGNEKVISI